MTPRHRNTTRALATREGAAEPEVCGQEQGIEQAAAPLLGGGGQHGHGGDQGGDQQQGQGDAIEAEIEAEANLRQPGDREISGRMAPEPQAGKQLKQAGGCSGCGPDRKG